MSVHKPFRSIAVAREIESPENPGGMEKRVALIPEDVRQLCELGLKVYVEHNAGAGVGFSDQQYQAAGANLESSDNIYSDKDLIIKFKGPAIASIQQMRSGCTLFCMAHFYSFPERANMLKQREINVIAMEEVLESPKEVSDETILSRTSMAAALQPFIKDNSIESLHVRVIGWTPTLAGCIRRAGNRSPKTLQVLPLELKHEHLDERGESVLIFYDSMSFNDPCNAIPKLKSSGVHIFNRADFVRKHGYEAIQNYRVSHPPFKFGMRRIQCLHETGQAGARYGISLLKKNKPDINIAKAKVLVLGYGNVGSGAIHEIYDQGVERIHILGRCHTSSDKIVPYLRGVDLVINGAEQARELRGKNFLITKQHVSDLIPEGSVIIDLVGGSPSNRSPVESVVSCTFLNDPFFVEEGVSISSLWGWPMMGMTRETAIRYSNQITDVLTGPEDLISGLDHLTPGVRKALVCGLFPQN